MSPASPVFASVAPRLGVLAGAALMVLGCAGPRTTLSTRGFPHAERRAAAQGEMLALRLASPEENPTLQVMWMQPQEVKK